MLCCISYVNKFTLQDNFGHPSNAACKTLKLATPLSLLFSVRSSLEISDMHDHSLIASLLTFSAFAGGTNGTLNWSRGSRR